MAEQLGFQKRFGHRPAIDGQKHPVAATAFNMNGLGHQFLARSRFPLDNDAGIVLSNDLYHFIQFPHGIGMTD